MPINADAPAGEAGLKARDAGNQAFKLDPELAEVQAVRGYHAFLFDWDWPESEASYRRSLAINPGFSVAHRHLGHLYSQMGRHDEARNEMRRAVALDPFNLLNHALSSQVAFQARDHNSAVAFATRTIALDPEFWIGHMQLAQAYEQLGRMDESLAAVTNAARFSGGNSKAHSLRGYILARMGRTQEAREVLNTLEAAARDRYVPPYATALVQAGLGASDAVFTALDAAYDARDVHLVFLTVDPKWDRYRTDPRFTALLQRCGFVFEPS
jgi:tetratricopeptide (TPR) repeat protein